MPTYEFRCPDGTVIERIFKMSDVPNEIPLPDGSGVATRMISGGAGLLFKGTGFYITDYGKDGKKDQRTAAAGEGKGASESKSSDSKASDGASATASPKGEGKSDTKSDAKPASSSPAPATPSSTPKSD
ncbi:MAG TPA: hypothetical protein VE869_00455 [Gemmatimonas sp.]|nr:hypothetical protein [Gemmatimonas sp.]